jgi:hypothetical protein
MLVIQTICDIVCLSNTKQDNNMTFYGLKRNGIPLRFGNESNEDGEFCCETAYYLTDDGNGIWLVEDRSIAEKAAKTDTKWYCAGYNTPMNPYTKDNLEIFSVEI